MDENHYVLEVEATSPSYATTSDGVLTLEKYMELVELYAFVLLGKVLNTMDAAIAWVKKAEIPETKREVIILHGFWFAPFMSVECWDFSASPDVKYSKDF